MAIPLRRSLWPSLATRLLIATLAVLVWSGPGGGGGARLAELAHELGFAEKPGCGAFHLPSASNPRGVALGWAVAADADETNPEPIELLFVSGDEAASNADVRALAERANRVVVLTMFHELAGGWADLILPSTAALERDGTSMNLEGRVQRIRRAVLPPCPDELAWISKLAARFGVGVGPHAAGVFSEVAAELYRDLTLDDLGGHAPLPARHAYVAPAEATTLDPAEGPGGGLKLQRYTALFSGPAVERVPELGFQRPDRDVEIAAGDAASRGIANGDSVLVCSNGASVPRPSEMFVPSSSTVPGYSSAASSRRRFGDGGMYASPVASSIMVRRQPATGTTYSVAPMPNRS